jgi:hypothetical protein
MIKWKCNKNNFSISDVVLCSFGLYRTLPVYSTTKDTTLRVSWKNKSLIASINKVNSDIEKIEEKLPVLQSSFYHFLRN